MTEHTDAVAIVTGGGRGIDRAVPLLAAERGLSVCLSSVSEMSAARLHRMMATNVIGSFLCACAAVRRISANSGGRGGATVSLSSVAAKLGGA